MRERAVHARHEQGMALLTVLMLTALMFILAAGMLVGASREIFFAGLHRDAAIADEAALAATEDAIRRLEAGRPWNPGTADPEGRCVQDDGAPGLRLGMPGGETCVAVLTRLPGVSGAMLDVRVDSVSGRAQRRLTTVLLARTETALPEILVLDHLAEPPGVEITSGVVHVRTFAAYLSALSAERTTYAGWRIRQVGTPAGPGSEPATGTPGPKAASCYTHAECVAAGRPQWWPGHRRAVYTGRPLRPAPLPGNPAPDPRDPGVFLTYECPTGPPSSLALQTVGTDGPGFQRGDLRGDLHPADSRQSAVSTEPLYGCTADGLAYTWVREAFDTDDDPDGDPDRFIWFPVVRFDRWLARYACFDERALVWLPCNGFDPDPARGDPSLGAVLPLIPDDAWMQNYDQRVSGGAVLAGAELDLGRCADPPLCRDPSNVRRTVVLAGGSYTLLCGGGCREGLGVLVVGGDLGVSGAFTYRGVMVVRGRVVALAGAVITIQGSLSAAGLVSEGGVMRLDPGVQVAVGQAGPAGVIRKAWWER